MLNTAFLPWPSYTDEEADAVREVLLTNAVNYWTGNECREFEKEFADWVDARYSIAISNGTVALEAALNAAGIGPGDDVIVTPRTFIASVSSIVMAGARPVFAEIDPDTQNITAESIAARLTPKSKAIVCVHLAGMPCDMDPIMRLAEEKNLFVIEDCAQAHGARYKGRSVGTIGHVGTWSFCQDKIMTTGGEGGMLTTNDPDLWSRMWSYKDHGKNWEAVYEREHPPGFRWLHDSFGTNGRMTEMQAAIGRIQLRRMNEWTSTRRENMRRILETASKLSGLRVPNIPAWAEHAAYKCYVFVDDSVLPSDWNRDRIMSAINDRGVPCYSGSCSEVYREKALMDRGLGPRDRLPVARELGETSLMFLVHPTLTTEHIDRTCDVLTEVMENVVETG
jgi:dTDP-4-amino-4,6-dideoxygalactose transaminase